MTATTANLADPSAEWWFVPDVAAALADSPSGHAVKTPTIRQYLWQARKHARDEGARRPGDIPEPDGMRRPAEHPAAPPRPAWNPAGPIRGWIAARQPSGHARSDGQPRRSRADVITWLAAQDGLVTVAGAAAATGASKDLVRKVVNDMTAAGRLEAAATSPPSYLPRPG